MGGTACPWHAALQRRQALVGPRPRPGADASRADRRHGKPHAAAGARLLDNGRPGTVPQLHRGTAGLIGSAASSRNCGVGQPVASLVMATATTTVTTST